MRMNGLRCEELMPEGSAFIALSQEFGVTSAIGCRLSFAALLIEHARSARSRVAIRSTAARSASMSVRSQRMKSGRCALRASVCASFSDACDVDVDEGDLRALAGKRGDDRRADPRSAAGHEHDAVLQARIAREGARAGLELRDGHANPLRCPECSVRQAGQHALLCLRFR